MPTTRNADREAFLSYAPIRLTQEQKRALTRKRPVRFVIQFTALAALYAALASVGMLVDHPALWVPIWIVLGAMLGGLNLVGHECVHSSFSGSRWLNRLAGSLFMATNFLNFTLHRGYHLKHHAHTMQEGDTQEEIGLYGYRSRAEYLKGLLSWSTIFNSFFYNEWKYSVLAFFGRRTAFFNTKTSDLAAVKTDFIVMLLWCAAVATFTWNAPEIAVKTFLVPVCVFFPLILYLISLPEHYKVDAGGNALENTRTVRSSWLVRQIFWNINYHTAHHAFPYVPFYNLPKAHKLLEKQVKYSEASYLGFHLKTFRDLRGAPAVERERA
ncbi:fatty acid desaturase (plasmid) [Ralstonia solanacearum]|uniref:Probable fatty acid desaturase transmembrane protein n=1 Tax=Ralstonia nicotianae (strain ATCC BAA-1114 / GMI1000) TaxID=267608 RepID=Q8XRP7_RALN1|nr:fatty acid desaturase [Ralstonia pseudosolanacearum]AKZ28864.1 omega-3 fatty acid desaturase [Ralstonia solanacearum]ASL76615.1 omega-3 fatty acid desaturase [Ralstonia pseudosolanacearum]AST29782.1 omega-3 fatty acid desaturase [Ralstonia pseudosolanacearum]AZU58322.1 omega-3 fatty acid desaturase [Ralstonia solanacearum]MCK4136865.1 fatty acid desaturase [Ralstonia pseudosolanacearum]